MAGRKSMTEAASSWQAAAADAGQAVRPDALPLPLIQHLRVAQPSTHRPGLAAPGSRTTISPQLAKADTAFQARPLVNRLNLA